jgi:hypothetical protein
MFRKLIIASAACLAIAGSLSAAPAARAQEERQTYEEFCRQYDANAGLNGGLSDSAQALTELRQAAQWDDLARSAEKNAAESVDAADKQMWNDSAKLYRENAAKLRESALKLMEQMKANFEKFRQNCAPDTVGRKATLVIQRDVEEVEKQSREHSAELDRKQQQRIQDREKAPKAKTETRKPKPRATVKEDRRNKRKVKHSNKRRNNEVAAQVVTGIALSIAANALMARDDNDHGHMERMEPKRKNGHSRKLRKHRKGMEMGNGEMMLGF